MFRLSDYGLIAWLLVPIIGLALAPAAYRAQTMPVLYLAVAMCLVGLVLMKLKMRSTRTLIKQLHLTGIYVRDFLKFTTAVLPLSLLGLKFGVQLSGILFVFWVIAHEKQGLFPQWIGRISSDLAPRNLIEQILALRYDDLRRVVSERFIGHYARRTPEVQLSYLLDSLVVQAPTAISRSHIEHLRGLVAYTTGKLEIAETIFRSLTMGKAPAVLKAAAGFYLTRLLTEKSRHDEAEQIRHQILGLQGIGHIRDLIAVDLADWYLSTRRPDLGREILTEAIQVSDNGWNKSVLYHHLAMMMMGMGRYREAVYAMKTALGMAGPYNQYDQVVGLATIYIEVGDYAEARQLLDLYEKKIRSAEQLARLLQLQALTAIYQGRPGIALTILDAGGESDKLSREVFLGSKLFRALALVFTGNREAAISLLNEIRPWFTRPFQFYYAFVIATGLRDEAAAQEFRAQLTSSQQFDYYVRKVECNETSPLLNQPPQKGSE